ncbi:hypothetical protein CSC70_05990 [Pseudoxanthomonas kalamensis DSM 18571]|uniref:restriction endonuclease n=1 Tax=Pseudoxanthomonas kalamensis TaxID=289483 RepID=UPI0013918354|nr:restriction endonuclease [Pseudoxanthomonas kalamensis]KAF1711451.1 hypothetical protein CSC70_05990 [Pseudoxanthomonas kalamensis DSM 18571]
MEHQPETPRPGQRPRRPDLIARRPLELALADYYRGQGYAVTRLESDGSSRDFDGFDLLLKLDERFIVLACRHDPLHPVTQHTILGLYARLPRLGASDLIVVTTGQFTVSAREAADHYPNLQLVDGRLLRILLGEERLDTLHRDLELARQVSESNRATDTKPKPRPALALCEPQQGRLPRACLALASLALLSAVVLLGWMFSSHSGDKPAAKADDPVEQSPP